MAVASEDIRPFLLEFKRTTIYWINIKKEISQKALRIEKEKDSSKRKDKIMKEKNKREKILAGMLGGILVAMVLLGCVLLSPAEGILKEEKLRVVIAEDTTHEGLLTIPKNETWEIQNCTYTVIEGCIEVDGSLIVKNATLEYESEEKTWGEVSVKGKFIAENSLIGFGGVSFESGSEGKLIQSTGNLVTISPMWTEGNIHNIKLDISKCRISYLQLGGNPDVEVTLTDENIIEEYTLVCSIPKEKEFRMVDNEIVSDPGSYSFPTIHISPLTEISHKIDKLAIEKDAVAVLENTDIFSEITCGNGTLKTKHVTTDYVDAWESTVLMLYSYARSLSCAYRTCVVLLNTEIDHKRIYTEIGHKRIYRDSLILNIKTVHPRKLSFSLVVGDEAKTKKVNYYIDDNPVGSANTAPFECMIDISDYSDIEHTIKATVYPRDGAPVKIFVLVDFSEIEW